MYGSINLKYFNHSKNIFHVLNTFVSDRNFSLCSNLFQCVLSKTSDKTKIIQRKLAWPLRKDDIDYKLNKQ